MAAKKKSDKKEGDEGSGKKKDKDNLFTSMLKELTTGVILGSLQNIYENFLKTMQDYAYKTQRRVIDIFIIFAIFMMGIVLILISLIFLINQYLRLSFGWSILIIGGFLLIMSYVMKNRIERQEVR